MLSSGRGDLFRRRNLVLLGLLVLLVGVRIGLPYVLRWQIVEQADAALVGRVALADIDLSLARGGVTLHDLAVHAAELPAPGSAAEPPVFAVKRLWVQISWLALATRTLRVEELELDDFAVRVERTRDGLILPAPVPSPAEAVPVAEEPEEPLGWSFAADSVALRDGHLLFRDHTVGESGQDFELAIEDFSAAQLALAIDPSGLEPGRVRVDARVGEGSIGLDAVVESRREGPAVTSKIRLVNLAVDGVRPYLAEQLGWSSLTARLDAEIEHRFETAGAHQVGGRVALRDVQVGVAGLERAALGWKQLEVVLGGVDLIAQHADVSEVALVGPRVVVDPKGEPPLPAMAPPTRRPVAAPDPAAPEPPAVVASAETSKPWTWRATRAHIDGGVVELGRAAPLEIAVDAEIRDVSSERGSRWPLTLKVAPPEGTLALAAGLVLEPLRVDGTLRVADFALPPILAQLDAPGVALLRKGVARADLAFALAPRKGDTSREPVTDLQVSGTLGLAGLDVGDAKTPEFAAAWRDFEIGIRELALPELLGSRDPAAPRKIGVALSQVRLIEPSFRVTRGPNGIVLPPLGGPAAAPTAAAATTPAAPETPAPEISVEVVRAEIRRARGQISDRSVKPPFQSSIERFDLTAGDVRWPERRIGSLDAALAGLQGAKLSVRGKLAPGGTRIEAKLANLSLGAFNSYVLPTGYSVASGALSLDTKASLTRDTYDAGTDVRVAQLELGGAEGEATFAQNFGIPLSFALGLLKDTNGDITLNVPVAGDREGTRVAIGAIVRQALRKALTGALASPLKLLGAVTQDGKVQSLAPQPIDFEAGATNPNASGRVRLEEIAKLLAGSPALALRLRGTASADDLRGFQEQSLLEELRKTSGLRALGQLGEINMRRAVRVHLEEKLRGGVPQPLEPAQETWLEGQLTGRTIDPARLAGLAAARARSVQQTLVSQHDIAPERLQLELATDADLATLASVAIALGPGETLPPVASDRPAGAPPSGDQKM